MSFDDGQSQMRQGKIIKGVDFAPAEAGKDQWIIIWNAATQTFILANPSGVVITSAQIIAALGFTPMANTSAAIATALGFTPLANTSAAIAVALGYTPLANTLAAVVAALGYTPENIANKGVANGYADLNSSTKITKALASLSQIPQGGASTNQILQWNGTSWVPAALPGGSVSEVQFLQGQAALGKLIMSAGQLLPATDSTVVTSYTPANGATFVLFEASVSIGGSTTSATFSGALRNNVTVRGYVSHGLATGATVTTSDYKFPVKGDQLVGTGSLVYDIYCITAGGTSLTQISGNICGYLL